MKDIVALVHEFSQLLKNNSDKNKKEWWENYLRNEISFIGIGIPDIRKLLIEWHTSNKLLDEPNSVQFKIAEEFLKLDQAEEKISGILYIQLFLLKPNNYNDILSLIEIIVDNEHIFDWNTCDWLAVRILTAIVESNDKKLVNQIISWKDAEYLWKARASAVAFAQAKNLSQYLNEVKSINTILIKRPERFSKTAVGWMLREISKINKDFVVNFIERYIKYFSKETINNSLKYFPKGLKKEYIERMKFLRENEG